MSVVLGVVMTAGVPDMPEWGDEQQEALGTWASEFRKKQDTVGVHLCAIVDVEMAQSRQDPERCRAIGGLYLALLTLRRADGADHELAHMLLPQIHEMIARAHHEAQIEDLKREAGIE